MCVCVCESERERDRESLYVCAGQSGNGGCSSCDAAYAGANCDVSISLVVVPTLVVVIGSLSAIIIFAVWYIKRSVSPAEMHVYSTLAMRR